MMAFKRVIPGPFMAAGGVTGRFAHFPVRPESFRHESFRTPLRESFRPPTLSRFAHYLISRFDHFLS